MKIGFGYTIGPEVTAEHNGTLIGDLERFGFDSMWVPESDRADRRVTRRHDR